MPTFRTQSSSNLSESVRRLVNSSRNPSELELLQVDAKAADMARNTALAEKARLEAEELRKAAAAREDPAARTEFASNSAGINYDTGTRLMAHIRGALEQPSVADIDDADRVGATAQPFRTAAPVIEPGQDRRFRSALAATMANTLATGKTNADQLTSATGNVQGQGVAEAVRAAIESGDFQGASALNQGARPGTAIRLHDNIGSTGATFAPATGKVGADPAADPSNKLLPATLASEAAEAEQRRAAAEASRAQAERARREPSEASKPPVGYRWKADGSLEKIPGGPADSKGAESPHGKPPPGYRWGDADEAGHPTLVPIAGGPAEKLGETQVKQLVGVQNTRNAITEYRTAIKKFGVTDMMNPNARAKMGTVYNNMMLQAKEAYNLGVLNGPDYDILQSVVADPTSLRAGLISKDALDAQAAKLDEIMQRIGLTVGAASKQRTPAATPPGGAGWGIRRLP